MTAPDPADAALWALAYVDARECGDDAGTEVLVESIGKDAAIERLGGAAAGSMELIANALGLSLAEYSAAARLAYLHTETS